MLWWLFFLMLFVIVFLFFICVLLFCSDYLLICGFPGSQAQHSFIKWALIFIITQDVFNSKICLTWRRHPIYGCLTAGEEKNFKKPLEWCIKEIIWMCDISAPTLLRAQKWFSTCGQSEKGANMHSCKPDFSVFPSSVAVQQPHLFLFSCWKPKPNHSNALKSEA